MDENMPLDPRLEADSIFLGKLRSCDVRLAKDARWPWLILVPACNVIELHELTVDELEAVTLDTKDASKALKEITGCQKINSASIGNVVSQLHIHVVARSEGDPNWPKPIWGFGAPTTYDNAVLDTFINETKKKLFS